ncbi:DUF2887 domain-containing protein [Thiocapsa marina]|uniref:DUF4351 domain-containing protein n=1 Tax=Thiocapsa marina 5811 TaxID=768671 RepID=F9UH91_9GAMM|nr:DUF2887 domain-containing protein [Thiocapsa marina]EGV16349.1 hypothetical protein ThimaDRAFT_4294 [Thiocapsa marina 5811]
MKTDNPIYLFLSAGAEAFRVLTGGHELVGPYRFCSLTIKGLERRLDGIFEPDGHDGPVYVVEFQGQHSDKAWYNLLTKIGLYGEEHPHRDVIGVGIFLREQDRPRFPRWANQAQAPLLQVALRRVLPDWLAREPDNPYVAVFAPLLIDDDEDLRARAQDLWRTVQDVSLAPEVREILGQVLEFWFFERFRGLTAKEIWAMLNLVTPIQETKAYQSIFAEGEAKGEEKGEAKGEAKGKAMGQAMGKAMGKAESLKRLLTRRFGPLPTEAEQRIDTAPVAQLDAWLDGIFDAPSLEDLIGGHAGPAP